MASAVANWPVEVKDSPTVYRGTEFEWTLQLGDDGATVDLTPFGTDWSATLRANMQDADSASVPFTVDATHLADGYIILTLTGDQTARMIRADEYGFDVIATGGTVSPFPMWKGSVVMDGSYTLHA